MIRVLIVDDEPPARRKVRRFLEADPEVGAVADAAGGREALDLIRTFQPDLVFLDVQMPDMDGFAVLDAVGVDRSFHVVFLTAHQEHALRAFEAEAFDYLLKPVDPDRFERVLQRAREQIQLRLRKPAADPPTYLKRILVEHQRREIFVPVERIDWAEADRNYISLHAGPEVCTIRGALAQLAKRLDPDQFARISRSALVNLDSIREMQPWFHGERRIFLKDGVELTWTRRYRAHSSSD
ncbi:MAG TPA: LytTR family DNA-binding domain-containing protein [Bryobacteraceae bacterium]|nr:LytTR family DNA-binding domain-containing protein [Bryobacteraceae bacterium]